MNNVLQVMMSIPWFAWVPIVAIIVGGIIKIVAMMHVHAERMEMIRAGMTPEPNPAERQDT